MFILARNKDQTIDFPALGISIKILHVSGNKVRLGIEAPQEIAIRRAELTDDDSNEPRSDTNQKWAASVRERLQHAAVELNLLHRQFEEQDFDEVETTIFRLFRELEMMDKKLSVVAQSSSAEPLAPVIQHALVVSDKPREADFMAQCLGKHGYDVDVANNRSAALRQLRSHIKPDVVMLDMHVLGAEARSFIEAIRQDPALDGVKILVISSHPHDPVAKQPTMQGIDHWLVRPIDTDELCQAIEANISAPSDDSCF